MGNAPGYPLVVPPFNAVSTGFSGGRFFRVYQEGESLLFITYPGRSKWHLFCMHFGLLGALLWSFIRRSFERKRDALFRELDSMHPEQRMQRDKHNFAVNRGQLLAPAVEPIGFFKRGGAAAAWRFKTPEKGELAMDLPTVDDVATLLQNLPRFSLAPLNVQVVWNDAKKRYLKAS